jgi:hypothetical protein
MIRMDYGPNHGITPGAAPLRSMGRPRVGALPWCCLIALLPSCVYLPYTTEVYDHNCQVTARHMEMELTQVGSFGRCRNEGCAALLVAAGAATAASAVVSGSIVVTGNIVYWFEKQGQCVR